MDGFIKLYKKIENWQWYKDSTTLHLFIDLLLDANYEDSKVGFEIIKRGQCLTSLKRMHERTGLTIKQIRTALDKLEKSGEIGKQTTNRNSIITINKYNDYQEKGKQTASKRQTKGNIKEYKEYQEEKEYIKESISKDILKKSFLKPTLQEIKNYCNERNNDVDAERFYNFYESKGWMVGKNKMKDWKACVRTWEKKNNDNLPEWFNDEPMRKEIDYERKKLAEQLTNGTWKP